MNVRNIEKFIDLVLSEKLKSYHKSEKIPETNDGAVTVIVGEEYDKIVKDSTKDVFVLYSAPWSHDCRQLAPTWQSLGEHFKDNKDVVIGEFDATKNEAKGLDIVFYPTLVFYPKYNKQEGVTYDGEKDIESLKKWVELNSSIVMEAALEDGKDSSETKHDEL